jgi:hypothetical protein
MSRQDCTVGTPPQTDCAAGDLPFQTQSEQPRNGAGPGTEQPCFDRGDPVEWRQPDGTWRNGWQFKAGMDNKQALISRATASTPRPQWFPELVEVLRREPGLIAAQAVLHLDKAGHRGLQGRTIKPWMDAARQEATAPGDSATESRCVLLADLRRCA